MSLKMNYVVLGTNNMNAAIDFYEALFADSGPSKIFEGDRMTLWQGDDFLFAIAIPFDENPATNGNGTMIGFNAESAEQVKAFYDRAIELGGTDEGEPGIRSNRYSAYVRDLDNNKLCFFE